MVTVILPEVAFDGIGTINDVAVDEGNTLIARITLNFTWLFAGRSKFVPEIVILPYRPVAITGVKLEIVGAFVAVVTTNELLLTAVPSGDVTDTGPVVAPVGTEVTSCVLDDDATVTEVPLKLTAFCEGVALNPVP